MNFEFSTAVLLYTLRAVIGDAGGVARLSNSSPVQETEDLELFDADANLIHPLYQSDNITPETLMKSANENGVKWFLVTGSTLVDSNQVLDLSLKHPYVIGTAGIHPYNTLTDEYSDNSLNLLEEMANRPECMAVVSSTRYGL